MKGFPQTKAIVIFLFMLFIFQIQELNHTQQVNNTLQNYDIMRNYNQLLTEDYYPKYITCWTKY